MKTMGIIEQYGYTMEHMGRSAAEAAEYREQGMWAEAHRAQQMTEKYREAAHKLHVRIKAAFFTDAVDPAELDIPVRTATIHQINAKAA